MNAFQYNEPVRFEFRRDEVPDGPVRHDRARMDRRVAAAITIGAALWPSAALSAAATVTLAASGDLPGATWATAVPLIACVAAVAGAVAGRACWPRLGCGGLARPLAYALTTTAATSVLLLALTVVMR